LPVLPEAVEHYVLKAAVMHALKYVEVAMPVELKDELQMAAASGGKVVVSDAVVEELVEGMSERWDMPLLNDKQQVDLSRQALKVLLQNDATVMGVVGRSLGRATHGSTRTLLDPAARAELTDTLCGKVNLGGLVSESATRAAIAGGVEAVAKVVKAVIPDELEDVILATNGRETKAELEGLRQQLVTVVNAKVNVPFVGEDVEQKIVERIVDHVMKVVVRSSGIMEANEGPGETLARLRLEEQALVASMEATARVTARRMEGIMRQLQAVEELKKECKRELKAQK